VILLSIEELEKKIDSSDDVITEKINEDDNKLDSDKIYRVIN
jgi:hypothetical protein